VRGSRPVAMWGGLALAGLVAAGVLAYVALPKAPPPATPAPPTPAPTTTTLASRPRLDPTLVADGGVTPHEDAAAPALAAAPATIVAASPPPAARVAAAPVRPSPATRPTPRATPTTLAAAPVTQPPQPSPVAPTPVPTPVGEGMLQVAVRPWGEVFLDGRPVGTTPLDRLTLTAGPHVVRVHYPGYDDVERRIVVRAGQTEVLKVDFSAEGVRK